MYSVILCGGAGTRLWPLSRKNFPKQFLNLCGEKSLLENTFLRMRKLMPAENIFFITNKENFYNVFNLIKDVEKNFSKEQILVEPASLNTAPAIACAVKHLLEKFGAGPDEPIIFLPADHYIGDEKEYLRVVKLAADNVSGRIGTIGITPTKAETGYGYIKKDLAGFDGNFYKVAEFKEKPDKETAERYINSGQYVWNSGMYIFSSRTFVNELKKYAPEIYGLMARDFDSFAADFKSLPEVSIDYAISEKSDNVAVFEGDFGWSDIGSFDSLAEITASNGQKIGRHIALDSKNVFTHSAGGRLIVTIGVDDINVIENNDSILIHKRGRGEDVKKVVKHLKEKGAKELDDNLVVCRPWGRYEVLIDSSVYKVKKIVVYPGAKLSLQAHYHRAEHWVVVRGLAKIVNGGEEKFLRENESTFIPSLATHRLENPGKINLEMIEVQTGNYMEEDDIIRYEDTYGRIEEKK